MKRSKFVIISTILGSLLSINPVAFQHKAFAAQKLEAANLSYTQNPRTTLGQQSPGYYRTVDTLSVRVVAQGMQTWKSIAERNLSSLHSLFPTQLPRTFANGQFAFTNIHTGKLAYVVLREGSRLQGVSRVSQQAQSNANFNAVNGYSELSSFPALNRFPQSLFESGQIIEVVRYAARYDGSSTRSSAQRSRQSTLPNGKKAYYLEQDNGRQGWCAFEDESARFSSFICVNLTDSSSIALDTLKSIMEK